MIIIRLAKLAVISSVLFTSASFAVLTDDLSKVYHRLLRDFSYNDYTFSQKHITKGTSVTSKKSSITSVLPDFNDKDFPIVVFPVLSGKDVVTIDIFSSSEKASLGEGEDWLVLMANTFNKKKRRLTTKDSKFVQLRVRKIASGAATSFLASKKEFAFAGGFSPSNIYWAKMLKAYGVDTEVIDVKRKKGPEHVRGLVGNLAGIVIKKSVLQKLGETKDTLTVSKMIEAVKDEKVKFGYTNPYISSTGLNFLVTALNSIAQGRSITDSSVIAEFREFQKSIPQPIQDTTVIIDNIKAGKNTFEAFVLEHQSFLNVKETLGDYEFVPFGIRHDNPLVCIKTGDVNIDEENCGGLKRFARFIVKNRRALKVAKEYGFNQNDTYKAPSELADLMITSNVGEALINAQTAWKLNKSSSNKIAAIFLGDVSGSMGRGTGRIEALRKALETSANFINESTSIGLMKFNHLTRELLPIRPFDLEHKEKFVAGAQSLVSGGGTSMWDGVVFATKTLVDFRDQNPGARLILFVLGDGDDENSLSTDFWNGVSTSRIMEMVNDNGVQVHTIGLGDNINMSPLERIAQETEGSSKKRNLSNVETYIANLLNSQL